MNCKPLAGILAISALFMLAPGMAYACYCADKPGGGFICETHCAPHEIEAKLGPGHGPVEMVSDTLTGDNLSGNPAGGGGGNNSGGSAIGGSPATGNGSTSGGSGTGGGTPSCYMSATGDFVCPQEGTGTASTPGNTGGSNNKPGIGAQMPQPTANNPTPTNPVSPSGTGGGGGSSPVNSGNASTAYQWPPGFSPTPVCGETWEESVNNSAMANLPTVGAITAKSGDVIKGVHVTTTDGPCINIPAGVTNVRITGSHIGPCGRPGDLDTYGVQINDGATNISVDRNVIHDISTGVVGIRAKNPIIMDRNCVYNIRGPFYRGQMVQFDNVRDGTSGSKITCNFVNTLNSPVSHVEDHINMFETSGLPDSPIEIAYNRIRGGKSQSGSGMVVGDGKKGGSNYYIHHNTIVDTANVGIGVVGGYNTRIENNRIYGEGKNPMQGTGITVRNFSEGGCGNHAVIGNRVFAREFAWGQGQEAHYINFNQCGAVQESGNVLGDKTLNSDIFFEEYPECQ